MSSKGVKRKNDNRNVKKKTKEEQPKKKQPCKNEKRPRAPARKDKNSDTDDESKPTQSPSTSEDTFEQAIDSQKCKTQRIQERRKKYNIQDVDESKPVKFDRLVLEYDDPIKKTPVIAVDPGIVAKLRPHQINGVMFMWETCFESVEQINADETGTGCILAHCMGLGKTLQIVTLVHTLFSHAATGVKRVLIVCPKTTIFNWMAEFRNWFKCADKQLQLNIYDVSDLSLPSTRLVVLRDWTEEGGVLVVGYEMFRNFYNLTKVRPTPYNKASITVITEALLNPGPDLVVCDEGHLLKNEETQVSVAVNETRTQRRIVLTGTPLQNNLKEYYCMVNLVNKNLLGTEDQYKSRFVIPINEGQFVDSTDDQIKEMRLRSHVLNRLLKQTIQRKDYGKLPPFLPDKFEFALFITLTPLQLTLYNNFLSFYATSTNGALLLRDFQTILRIYNHPLALKCYKDQKQEKMKQDLKKKKLMKITLPGIPPDWWEAALGKTKLENLQLSNKMLLLFDILEKCQAAGDKLLVFSQSLYTLDVIEHFLKAGCQGSWEPGEDYFRLDGSLSVTERSKQCDVFNSCGKARLFLISTRAGGLGINLFGANRVVLFDVSWNPSQDLQSIFRVYRFGQTKRCYIYRFIAMGTMEHKIYQRQITKLSVAKRVVDEQQVNRYFTAEELGDLYCLDPTSTTPRRVKLPADDSLLAEVIKHNHCIQEYHEPDSLLADMKEEQLSGEECMHAWREYERECESGDIPFDTAHRLRRDLLSGL